MRPYFHLDYEMSSYIDIAKLGGYRYAEDELTTILMFAIAGPGGRPVVWDFTDPFSEESEEAWDLFEEASSSNSLIYAWNAPFEHAVSRYKLEGALGIEPPKLDNYRCVAAMARRAAMPNALGKCAEALQIDQKKDTLGKKLINCFSDRTKLIVLKPPPGLKDFSTSERGRKPANRKSDSPIHGWEDDKGFHEEILWDWLVKIDGREITVRKAWEMFKEYCRQDVVVEREIHKTLHRFELEGAVLESFQFNLRMNDRGIPLNKTALGNAIKIIEEFQDYMRVRFEKLTGLRPTQTKKLVPWLQERGYNFDNLQAKTVEKALHPDFVGDLEPKAKKALEWLQLVTFAALKKVPAMLGAMCSDDRVRGTMLWHVARTGRAGGRIVQPQNMKKATLETCLAYEMLCEGCSLEDIEEFWDSPLEVIASCTRHFIQHPTKQFYDADFTGVEARITPWLAGNERKLASVLRGEDQYLQAASMASGIPYESLYRDYKEGTGEVYAKANKWRTIGKPIELSCIAEGQLVTTFRGLVPIEAIKLDDLLWDGKAWVRHEGLIFQGYKRVISYQGVTATPDHPVFTEERPGAIPLGEARRKAFRLRDAGAPRAQVGESDPLGPKICSSWSASQSAGRLRLRLRVSRLLRLLEKRADRSLPEMQGPRLEKGLSPVARQTIQRRKEKMRRSEIKAVQKLWGSRHRISFQESSSSGSVDARQYGIKRSRLRNRPHRQRGALRTRKHEMGNTPRTSVQFPARCFIRRLHFRSNQVALWQGQNLPNASERYDQKADFRKSKRGCFKQAKKLENNQGKVRVFDVLNCGPRNCFTVSGKLVHNCCFGTGARGMRTSLRETYGVKLSLKECKEIVKKYRDENPETVDAWQEIEDAFRAAIEGHTSHILGGRVKVGRIATAGMHYVVMKLPSGRNLFYPRCHTKRVPKKYDEEELAEEPWKKSPENWIEQIEAYGYWADEIRFWGSKDGKPFGWVATWGSRLFENLVQAIGADLLDRGCIECERQGHEIFMVVHDQALGEENELGLDHFVKAYTTKDKWAETFPLEAEGAVVPYYRKD